MLREKKRYTGNDRKWIDDFWNIKFIRDFHYSLNVKDVQILNIQSSKDIDQNKTLKMER